MPFASLSTVLKTWLRHPVIDIRVTDAGEVMELKAQLDLLREQYKHLEGRFALMCERNMVLEDEKRKLKRK